MATRFTTPHIFKLALPKSVHCYIFTAYHISTAPNTSKRMCYFLDDATFFTTLLKIKFKRKILHPDKNSVEKFPAQFHRMSHKICDTICKKRNKLASQHFQDNIPKFADVNSSILFGQESVFQQRSPSNWGFSDRPNKIYDHTGPRPMWRSNRLPRIARELIRGQKTRANPYFGPGRIFYVAVK